MGGTWSAVNEPLDSVVLSSDDMSDSEAADKQEHQSDYSYTDGESDDYSGGDDSDEWNEQGDSGIVGVCDAVLAGIYHRRFAIEGNKVLSYIYTKKVP